MDWYYLSERHERIPVPESRLRALALGGVVRPTTMLWRRGMSTWLTCGEVRPEIFAPRTPAEEALSADDDRSPAAQLALQRIGEGVRGYLPWITAMGWIMVIPGILTALAALAAIITLIFKSSWITARALDANLPAAFVDNTSVIAATFAVILAGSLVQVWMGTQLISMRRNLQRAWVHGSVRELQRALSSVGAYCTTSVVVVAAVAAAGLTYAVWHFWPEKKSGEPPAPAPSSAPAKRVTI